jgi:hypothetical protein
VRLGSSWASLIGEHCRALTGPQSLLAAGVRETGGQERTERDATEKK